MPYSSTLLSSHSLILTAQNHVVRKPRSHAEAMCRLPQLTDWMRSCSNTRFVNEHDFKMSPAQLLLDCDCPKDSE